MATYKIYCEKSGHEALKAKIESLGGVITNLVQDGADYIWKISVEPKQPKEHRILAYANIDGTAHSFAKSFEWNADKIEALNFGHCDKCGAHRNRAKLFWVETEGKILQVGGECAKSYDCEWRLKNILDIVRSIGEFVEEGEYGFGGGNSVSYGWIARVSWYIFEKYGYVSNKKADENFTISSSNIIAGVPNKFATESEVIKYWQLAGERDVIAEVISYLEKELEKGFNEFFHNALCGIRSGKSKAFNTVVAAIGCYWKSLQQAPVAGKQYKTPSLGKVEVKGVVISSKEGTNQYGATHQDILFLDENYGKIWFRSTVYEIRQLKANDLIEGVLNIKEVKENITFANRPKLNKIGGEVSASA